MTEGYPVLCRGGALGRARQWIRSIAAAGRGIGVPGAFPAGSRFILMYHRILPRDVRLPYPIQPGMFVTAETFDRHIAWLKEHLEIIPLSRILDYEATAGRAAAAITFDDGWRDTWETAWPILRKHAALATVFLAAGFVGTSRWFWPERVAFLAARGSEEPGNHLTQRVDRMIEEMKCLSPEEREREIRETEERLRLRGGSVPDEPVTVTWEQAREMADSGIEFGSHTTHHIILTGVSTEDAETEVTGSKKTIEERLGRPCDLFCYPNGDFNNEVRSLVAGAGYRLAVTTRPGWVNAGSDPLALSRVGLHEDVSGTRAQLADRIRRAGRQTAPASREEGRG